MAVFCKTIANGFPLAAVRGKKALMDSIVDPTAPKRRFVAGKAQNGTATGRRRSGFSDQSLTGVRCSQRGRGLRAAAARLDARVEKATTTEISYERFEGVKDGRL